MSAAPVAVAIGVFDGVHRGHRALIDRARREATERGLDLVAVTFDPHPAEVVRPGSSPELLTTIAHRCRLLVEAGADRVHVLAFDRQMSQLPPDEFVTEVLRGEVGASVAVVGENFRFGRGAAGAPDDLAAGGISVVTMGLSQQDGEAVSSTRVRQLIAQGEVADAAQLLGRPHRVQGVVVHGDHRGRELGFPTANLGEIGRSAVPADGVYAATLVIDPDGTGAPVWPAAVSVGTNPTFGELDRRVEAYAIDTGHELDLYGQPVAVDFGTRLRGMEAFDSVESLIAQMNADVTDARAWLSRGSGPDGR